MTINDAKNFRDLMTGICEIYGKTASPMLVDMYFNALDDLKFEDIKVAVNKLIKTRTLQGMPKPAEIIELIKGNSDDLAKNGIEQIISAMESVGSYRTVSFEDPILNRIVQSFGWSNLCSKTYDDLKYLIPTLQKEYKSYLLQDNSNYENIILPGLHDTGNRANGYEILQPVNKIGIEGNVESIPRIEQNKNNREVNPQIKDIAKKLGSI